MLRHKMIQARESVHKSTESEVSKRWAFEEGVSWLDSKYIYLCLVALWTVKIITG